MLLVAALVFAFGRIEELKDYLVRFAGWVDGLEFWGPLVYALGYAVATVAFFPGLLLTVAAGVLFGLVKGTLTVLAGATLGACGAFLVARYLARSAIERRLESHPKFRTIDRAVAREGLKIVFLLRLSPIFPFNLLNYALGLTSVKLRDFALASIGMAPGTFLYVYTGTALGSLAAVASGAGGEGGGTGQRLLFVFGLLATVVVTTIVTRIARRALDEEVPDA